jgi:hypothetical protein
MESSMTIRAAGMKILAEKLGIVNAERFITLMKREPVNYTEWQRELYKDVPLEAFLRDAMCFREAQVDIEK